MIDQIKDFIEDLRMDWAVFSYKCSQEYRDHCHNRLAAHQLAMKEGRNSPYTHPEDYSDNWTPIQKLQPIS